MARKSYCNDYGEEGSRDRSLPAESTGRGRWSGRWSPRSLHIVEWKYNFQLSFGENCEICMQYCSGLLTILLARVIGQYCFARWRLLSVVVICNTAGGRVGRPPGAFAVGRPTLHGGPVRLRPVQMTPCLYLFWVHISQKILGYCTHDIFSEHHTAHFEISTTYFVLRNTLF